MYPPSLLLVPNVNVSIICSLRKSEYSLEVSLCPAYSKRRGRLYKHQSTTRGFAKFLWCCSPRLNYRRPRVASPILSPSYSNKLPETEISARVECCTPGPNIAKGNYGDPYDSILRRLTRSSLYLDSNFIQHSISPTVLEAEARSARRGN